MKPLRRFFKPGEMPVFALSFLYFFLLLASYYILRPVRDALASGLGTREIRYLLLIVFISMLALTPVFGRLMTKIPRDRLLPRIYAFCAVNLLAFAWAFELQAAHDWAARVFYVWITVFNLFAVSVFWSFMADIWREEQGRRLFGAIAAGGSAGGLLGPLLAVSLVDHIGMSGLCSLAAGLLFGVMLCIGALNRQRKTANPNQAFASHAGAATDTVLQGSSWQGIKLVVTSPFLLGIAAMVLLGSTVAQFSYSETARLTQQLIDTPAARTAFFAQLDLWTNIAALCLQALVIGPLTARFGIVLPMMGLPLLGMVSFAALAVVPALNVLAASNVARRAGEFGMGKPARDMLYTVATPQEKYLAKNVIDTVVYRAGDVLGSSLYGLLAALGVGLAGFAGISIAAMFVAVMLALHLVRGYRARGGQ